VLHAPRLAYLRLLWSGWNRDRRRAREARRAVARLERQLRLLQRADGSALSTTDAPSLSMLVDRAREALVRGSPERDLGEIMNWAAGVRQRIDAGTPSLEDRRALYGAGREFYARQQRLHRFPGAYLVKAFNLAIKGLHYETVMHGIVTHDTSATSAASH
jgi:hypothetical protein